MKNKIQFPKIETKRLKLRQFKLNDAKNVQLLAGDFAIADTTCRIPHPYEDGLAENWIKTHQNLFDKNEEIIFAIELKNSKNLIGSVGLKITSCNNRAELGYWIGKNYWRNGYATEAAKAVIEYGFLKVKLHRIWACYFKRNEASGNVMKKSGMTYEGTFEEHMKKWEKYEDIVFFAILNKEFKIK